MNTWTHNADNTPTRWVKKDAQRLMEEATATASYYLNRAVLNIDEQFGEGYAAAHPMLVSLFMQTAAKDLDTAMRVKAADGIAQALEQLAQAFSDSHLGGAA